MSINIIYKNGEYHWELYDGPDGIDHYQGVSSTLGEAFEEIVKNRMINFIQYQ